MQELQLESPHTFLISIQVLYFGKSSLSFGQMTQIESPSILASGHPESKMKSKLDLQQTLALQVEQLKANMVEHTTSSSCNMLQEVASYYIRKPSKAIRPILILLMAQATNGLGSEWNMKREDSISCEKPESEFHFCSKFWRLNLTSRRCIDKSTPFGRSGRAAPCRIC